MKWKEELTVHGDAEHVGNEKSAQGEGGAMEGAEGGYVVNEGAACKKNVLHAGNEAHVDGTGACAGCAVEDDSGDGDDKGVGSAACDSTVNGECALVPASAPAPQLDLHGAWQKDAESVADAGLQVGAEAAAMGQMVDGLGKVASPFYYQIRNLGVRKS